MVAMFSKATILIMTAAILTSLRYLIYCCRFNVHIRQTNYSELQNIISLFNVIYSELITEYNLIIQTDYPTCCFFSKPETLKA